MKFRSVLFVIASLILAAAIVFAVPTDKEKKATDKKESKSCCEAGSAKASKDKGCKDMKDCSTEKTAMKSGSKDCCSEKSTKEVKAKDSESKPELKDNK